MEKQCGQYWHHMEYQNTRSISPKTYTKNPNVVLKLKVVQQILQHDHWRSAEMCSICHSVPISKVLNHAKCNKHNWCWNTFGADMTAGRPGFADNVTFLRKSVDSMQLMTSRVELSRMGGGYQINIWKRKIKQIADKSVGRVMTGQELIEEMWNFAYLGSMLTNNE